MYNIYVFYIYPLNGGIGWFVPFIYRIYFSNIYVQISNGFLIKAPHKECESACDVNSLRFAIMLPNCKYIYIHYFIYMPLNNNSAYNILYSQKRVDVWRRQVEVHAVFLLHVSPGVYLSMCVCVCLRVIFIKYHQIQKKICGYALTHIIFVAHPNA